MLKNDEVVFPPGDGERLVDVNEAALFLGVKKSFLYELSRPGRKRIPSLKIGRYRRFRKSDLLRWIEAQNRGAELIESCGKLNFSE